MYKPEQLCVTCSIDTFQEALERKVGWSSMIIVAIGTSDFHILCVVTSDIRFFAAPLLEPEESPSNDS